MEDQTKLCQAELYIGDDNEDGVATMRCMLPAGHEGQHEERFEREVGERKGWVFVRWDLDERGYRYGVFIRRTSHDCWRTLQRGSYEYCGEPLGL